MKLVCGEGRTISPMLLWLLIPPIHTSYQSWSRMVWVGALYRTKCLLVFNHHYRLANWQARITKPLHYKSCYHSTIQYLKEYGGWKCLVVSHRWTYLPWLPLFDALWYFRFLAFPLSTLFSSCWVYFPWVMPNKFSIVCLDFLFRMCWSATLSIFTPALLKTLAS